jgi:tRNA(Ile)-lysidine synthetase-like protein
VQQRKLRPQPTSRIKSSNLNHVKVVSRIIDKYLAQYAATAQDTPAERPPLLVAVSGGVDSCVLMHAILMAINKKTHRTLSQKVHFFYGNHGVRSKKAIASDLRCIQTIIDGVQSSAAALHVAHRSMNSNKAGGFSEASMRTWRYQQLQRCADAVKAKIVVTGHHWDDNLETALIKLLRGTSIQSFTLMEKRGCFPISSSSSSLIIDRPFLDLKKSQLQSYADYFGIEYSEDATNDNRQYLRNAVRLDVLPLLEKIRPGASDKIHQFFSELSVAAPVSTAEVPGATTGALWTSDLRTMPYQLFEEHIKNAVMAAGHSLKRAHFTELKNSYLKGLASKQKRTILLPGNIGVTIEAFRIKLAES